MRMNNTKNRARRAFETADKCDKVGHELGRSGDRWIALRDYDDSHYWQEMAGFEWDDEEQYWFTTDINKAMDVALIEDCEAGLFPEYYAKYGLRNLESPHNGDDIIRIIVRRGDKEIFNEVIK